MFSVKYGIMKSSKTAHDFTPTTEQLTGTIDSIFCNLVAEGKISDVDSKKRNIPLCLYVYEVPDVSFIDLI